MVSPDSLPNDPDLRILHRRGQFFAAWLSGSRPPVPLSPLDAWLARAPIQRAVADQPATGIANCESAAAKPPDKALRLGLNFALEPAAGGYRAWATARGRHVLLERDLARLLCAFGGGQSVQQLMADRADLGAPDALGPAIAWLLELGLLTAVIRPPVSAAEQTPPVKPVTEGVGANVDWRDIEPDHRIPVYFTPHMENHFPLALGMMHSAIQAHAQGALLDRFRLLPLAYLTPKELFEGPYRKFGPGVWLFSNYMWSLDINLQISAGIKAHADANFCIHGGPSTPGYQQACTDFMTRNPSVDVAVHGEGEVTIVELLDCIVRGQDGKIRLDGGRIEAVHGLTYRAATDGALTWTAPRARMRELDVIPSPYLTGVFDSYHGRVEAAIVESNRGCPFGCTFCDWGSATRQKVRKFDLERVEREIDWIGRNGIRVLWIADANFGMYDRDVDLARAIVETRARHGAPREVVVNYTKNTNKRLIEIIRAFSDGGIISQGIISIQTTDETTLEVINRKNIKTEKYDELAGVFAAAQLPLSTDLMIGLPGITTEAWDRDLQRYFDADVSVKAYPTQLLPNSPMADPEYLAKYRIETDDNDFVVACHSFTRAELEAMKAIYYALEIADGYGLLRYVLRYLQWEHELGALEVLHRLLSTARREPQRFPLLTWVLRFFLTEKTVPGGWRAFYRELASFIAEAYGLDGDAGLQTTLRVNELAMPDDTVDYPQTVALEHDFEAWFLARKQDSSHARPLVDYPPGQFSVDDPDLMAHIDMDYLQYDSHQYFWELRSTIARPKSVADIRDQLSEVA